MTDSSKHAPARTLPKRPSLGQLRKQAKELLKALRAGEPGALAEVARVDSQASSDRFTLVDAQRILARLYGFTGWVKLKDHVDTTSVSKFFADVRAGKTDAVRRRLAAASWLLHTGGGETGEETALHFAVLNCDNHMVRLLMEEGADARRGFWPHRAATTALQLATDREYGEIVRLITEIETSRRASHGAPGSDRIDELARTILQDKTDAAIRMLQDEPSLAGTYGNDGTTPLHLAAARQNVELATWLLDHGAAVDATNPYADQPGRNRAVSGLGRTALDYAVMHAGWAKQAKYYGWTASNDHFPHLQNRLMPPERFHRTIELLLDRGAHLTARAAVATADASTVRSMHDRGELIVENHVLRGGLLAIATRVNRIEMVRLLLEVGFNPDEPADSNDSERSHGFPLWFAALCGRHQIAELLLDHGADVNAIVLASGDALSNATATRDETMRSLLLNRGARLTVEVLPDDGLATAWAILRGEVEAESLNHPNPERRDILEALLGVTVGRDREFDRACLAQIERSTDDSWWASLLQTPSTTALESILQHGVHPDVAEAGEPTALHHVASDVINANGHMSDDRRVWHATMLLHAGASLTRRDKLMKSTPLGWACRWGRTELVELYLKHGADPIESGAERWATPMAWAARHDFPRIVQLLQAAGAPPLSQEQSTNGN